MKKIFISHASSDEFIATKLIDDILVGALSIKISEIFCSSTDGTKIESGEDWRNYIKDSLNSSKVTILIITPNYKESEVCICEMGAAWVTTAKVIPFIIEPISYTTVGIIQKPKQVEKLLDEQNLDRLKDIIQSKLEIPPDDIKSDRWTAKKIEFIQKITDHIKSKPFHKTLSREEYDKLIEDNIKLNTAIKSLISEKTTLENIIEDLKKVKDAGEVKEVENKYRDFNVIDEFNEICENISSKLHPFHPIIIGIIFISYSGKNISLVPNAWSEPIDKAISKDYITDTLEPDWTTTRLMKDLFKYLEELRQFIIANDSDENFIETYENEYNAPLSLSNIDFWKEAFDTNIFIS